MAKKKREKITILVSDTFTVLYAALMILLLAFFILLNSMAVIDDDHVKEALGSLLGSFGVLPGGLQVFSGDVYLPPGSPMLANEEETLPVSQDIHRALKRVRAGGRFNETVHLGENVTISMQNDDVVLTLSDKVLFGPNSAVLSGPYLRALEEMGDEFKIMENPIEVEGHTDDRPVQGGGYTSNWDLSAARAISIVRYFTEHCGVPTWRISAVAYGEHKPAASNETEEGRAKNRRVAIVIKAQ